MVQEVAERRVRSGWLGCSRCRHDYPVRDGEADLRVNPGAGTERRAPFLDDELAVKIVALAGVAEERDYLLVDDRLAHAADRVAELAVDLEVIVTLTAPEGDGTSRGVSRLVSDVRFPVAEYRLRAVAIAPADDRELVALAARRVAPGGRLVLFDASAGDVEEAEQSGLELVAAEGGMAVAERRLGSLPIVG